MPIFRLKIQWPYLQYTVLSSQFKVCSFSRAWGLQAGQPRARDLRTVNSRATPAYLDCGCLADPEDWLSDAGGVALVDGLSDPELLPEPLLELPPEPEFPGLEALP